MAASEIEKLVERYEEKAEDAWNEWQICGSLRHEGLYRKYMAVVYALRDGVNAARYRRQLCDMRNEILSAKTMDDLQRLKNRIAMREL